MKHYLKSTAKSCLALLALGFCASCTDVWDEHYSVDPSVVPDKSILEILESNPQTHKFVEVLKTTNTFNGKKMVSPTYYDLLGSDQFLTVWAPSDDSESISDEEWELYMKKNKTESEHYYVSQRFLNNHIARFNHPVGREKSVTMMSTKRYTMRADSTIQHKDYIMTNQACSNGILHILSDALEYQPNVYEFITTDAEYYDAEDTARYSMNLGNFFASYTKYEIDEEKSVQKGIVDGRIVYADSVLIEKSLLLDRFGLINREDSTYNLILPTGAAWKEAYQKAAVFYDFGLEEGADSMQWYWTGNALLTDAFFNMSATSQRYRESYDYFSTLMDWDEYYETNKLFHYYFNVFDRNNEINPAGEFGAPLRSVECSNGNVYIFDKWPFEPEYTYAVPNVREAEVTNAGFDAGDLAKTTEAVIRSIKDPSLNIFTSDISRGKLLCIKGGAITDAWECKFDIDDNLSGWFNIYAVIAPNSINRDVVPAKPNLFTVDISYNDRDPKAQRTHFQPVNARKRPIQFSNSLTKMDTIQLNVTLQGTDTVATPLFIPACSYDEERAKLSVSIKSAVTSNNTRTNSNTMLLDCIIVEPTEAPAEVEE